MLLGLDSNIFVKASIEFMYLHPIICSDGRCLERVFMNYELVLQYRSPHSHQFFNFFFESLSNCGIIWLLHFHDLHCYRRV